MEPLILITLVADYISCNTWRHFLYQPRSIWQPLSVICVFIHPIKRTHALFER